MKPEFAATLRNPLWWLLLVCLAMLPLVLPSYYLHIATLTLVYVALASAWNIVGGIGGQISLAHSLFVGCGAMLSSALLVRYGHWLGDAATGDLGTSLQTRQPQGRADGGVGLLKANGFLANRHDGLSEVSQRIRSKALPPTRSWRVLHTGREPGMRVLKTVVSAKGSRPRCQQERATTADGCGDAWR